MQYKEKISIQQIREYLFSKQYNSPHTEPALKTLEHYIGLIDQHTNALNDLNKQKPRNKNQIEIEQKTIAALKEKIDEKWRDYKNSVARDLEIRQQMLKDIKAEEKPKDPRIANLEKEIMALEELLRRMKVLEDPDLRLKALAGLKGLPESAPPSGVRPPWTAPKEPKLLAGLQSFEADHLHLKDKLQKLVDDHVIQSYNFNQNGFTVTTPSTPEKKSSLITFDLQSKKIFSNDTSQEAFDAAAKVTLAVGAKGFDMSELAKDTSQHGQDCLYRAYAAGKKLENDGFTFTGLSKDKTAELEQKYNDATQHMTPQSSGLT